MNEYQIYIKGRGHDDIAACAIVIVENGIEFFSGGKFFEGFIPTKNEVIDLLPNKMQYQMELYAIAWALTFCIKPAKVTFLTNNLAVKRWLEKGEVNEDYADIYEYCKKLSKGIEIKYEHIKKGTDELSDKCDSIAYQYEFQ